MSTQSSFVNPSLNPFARQQAAALAPRQPVVQKDRNRVSSHQAPAFIAWLDEIAVEAFRRRMLAVEPLDRLTRHPS
jgi:hypothetical protein